MQLRPHVFRQSCRCESEEATLMHMFLYRPKIQMYWTMELRSPQTHLCLGLPTGGRKVIVFSPLLARRLILFKWKDAAPPTVSQWINLD